MWPELPKRSNIPAFPMRRPPSKDDLHDEEGKSQTFTAPLGERRSAHFPEELTMRGKFA
jgi:hypothetical protein